ncbi:myb-like DNA-binding domain-containing protein [Xylariaceae sp. FL0016]|nr:myb-like DNA-binding domain-containing protein [Xylariaceae sp. FL0016]
MAPQASESPAKKQSKWSPEEDAVIIDLRGSGMKWDDISKRLPGRSPISCRLHYQNYLERRSEWDEERKNKLARLYERFKPEMWAKVAEEMAIPWRAAEAMHWTLGEQDMARRAGTTPFTLSAQTLEPSQGGARSSPRHIHGHGHTHSHSASGRGYGRGTPLTPTAGRPLVSRRDSLPPHPMPHHLPAHGDHHLHPHAAEQQQHHQQQQHHAPETSYTLSYPPPHSHSHHQPPPSLPQPHHQQPPPHAGGGPLAPIQTQARPGFLPGVAELTTGVSPYSTPAYSQGVPSASPVHSATASPGPYMPPLGYPPLESSATSAGVAGGGGSKRRRSPETMPPEMASRRRHFDLRQDPPFDQSAPRRMP